MKLAFFTLGCKVNQFETQALRMLFKERGHEISEADSETDAIIINTCTVTAISDKKSRQMIRRMSRDYPSALIAVCGCLTQVNPEQVRDIEGVDVISGTGEREKFVEIVENAYSSKEFTEVSDDPFKRSTCEILPVGGESEHTRAMLKVCDGCVNFCSYCIIPHTRGPVRSVPLETAVQQALELSGQGFREIVITGIEISSYGVDLTPRVSLIDLIEAVCKEVPNTRIRLGSLEPRSITEEFIERLAGFNNLCPHFHLSLQSGCDETLKRMRRKYDTGLFTDALTRLKNAFENCGITTDLIVGFPGETEEEFNKTLEFIKSRGFADMHIFPYSARAGTPAADLPEQITRAVKSERAEAAAELARASREEYLKSFIGRSLSVLWEEHKSGYWSGHSENYIRVYLKSDEQLRNRIDRVEIGGLFKNGLSAINII